MAILHYDESDSPHGETSRGTQTNSPNAHVVQDLVQSTTTLSHRVGIKYAYSLISLRRGLGDTLLTYLRAILMAPLHLGGTS